MQTLQSSRAPHALVHVLLGLATLALLIGCRTTSAEKPKSRDALILQSRLLRFSQYYSATVTAAADQIAEETDDREVRELTLRWKIRTIPLMHRIVGHEDPRYAVVDAWMVCVRQRITFTEGPLDTVFGPQQEIAVAKAKELETRIKAIASQALPVDDLDDAEREIEAFARGEPISGKFDTQLVRAGNRITKSSHPSVFNLLSIPIGGLDETADSIARLAKVGEAFTEVVAEMPERVRWETQLLLLEEARTGSLAEALEDFERFSLATESFAKSVDGLPERVREQVEALLPAADATIDKMQTLIAEVRALLAEVEGPLEAARATSAELSVAGTAWTSAGTTVDAAMTTISNMGDDATPSADTASYAADSADGSDDSFEVSDLTDAGNSLSVAAVEIRGLLADLESEKTGAKAEASLDEVTSRMEELVDTITVRALLVVGLLLVGLFLIRRFGPRSGAA